MGKNKLKFDALKKQCLIFDIETSAHYHSGKAVNIQSEFDNYVLMAKVKWFGAYSYKYNKYFNLEVSKHRPFIYKLLKEHKILVGFNSEDFDYPIICNNYLAEADDKHVNVDLMKILGKASFKDKKGFAYKDRGTLMNFKFKKNSLRHIGEVMGVDTVKGDIDYKIFEKDVYTEEETKEIITYLEGDIKSTKEIFDKVWEYWKPFTDLLYPKDIENLSWIRASIASLIYKSACYIMKVKPEFGDKTSSFEEMGGRVIDPKVEEKKNVWYIDFTSLYPHIMSMFNLFDEVDENTEDAFHGNDLFEVRGYYNTKEQHTLSKAVQEKLTQRVELKKNDPDNPMVYTLKIWLNGLYGCARSAIFKHVHTPNCGWDTCWLGQQLQEYTENRMKEFGFETIYGDTDSIMVYYSKDKCEMKEKDYIKGCLQIIINEILDNVPFKSNTFNIDIEDYLEYVMFPFSDQAIQDEEGNNIKLKNRLVKERKGKKKNYAYICESGGERKVKLVGLPIIKENATKLGIIIYNEVLNKKILDSCRAKFEKKEINSIIESYLERPEIMDIISIEYKVKPYKSYKSDGCIQAQISKQYLNSCEGVIRMVKNKKVGDIGKGAKYCTVLEAIEAKLTIDDIDLTKLYNELQPFILAKEESNV